MMPSVTCASISRLERRGEVTSDTSQALEAGQCRCLGKTPFVWGRLSIDWRHVSHNSSKP
jgi:hypothetical protein